MSATWRNWAGSQGCTPTRRLTPTTEAEIVDALTDAAGPGLPVRVAGSGHSFNPLATTEGVHVDMRRFAGVVSIDPSGQAVTVRAGTSLGRLNDELHRAGLSLANLGSLAEQTVGGAIATGNHGTGLAFGPLSSQVTSVRLITATGAALDLTAGTDLFRCAKTSLGALGIVTSVSFRCVPSFNVAVTTRRVSLEAALERFEEIVGAADQVSLSWPAWSDSLTARERRATPEPRTVGARWHQYSSTVDEVWGGLTGLAGAVAPRAVPALCELWGRLPRPAPHYIDANHRASTFPQPVRFLPLEHALPLQRVPEAIRALRTTLRRAGRYSPYPLLIRVGAADDAPLSPAYGRLTGYINLTVPRTEPYRHLLRTFEATLRDFHARPHWGKAHSATAEELAPLYGEWSLFQRIRAQTDPAGRFSSEYLTRLLGPVDNHR